MRSLPVRLLSSQPLELQLDHVCNVRQNGLLIKRLPYLRPSVAPAVLEAIKEFLCISSPYPPFYFYCWASTA